MASNLSEVQEQRDPWKEAKVLSDLEPGVLLLEAHGVTRMP